MSLGLPATTRAKARPSGPCSLWGRRTTQAATNSQLARFVRAGAVLAVMARDDLNYVQLYHGAPCPPRPGVARQCRAPEGYMMLETWQLGSSAADMEWLASKSRVDDPKDHVGSCHRWGPDVPAERYP